MWLIVSLLAALIVTGASFITPAKYKLGFLSLALWGLSACLFIDHALGYEGGEFLEMTTDGMITNGIVLGIAMLIPIFIIWESYIVVQNLKESSVTVKKTVTAKNSIKEV